MIEIAHQNGNTVTGYKGRPRAEAVERPQRLHREIRMNTELGCKHVPNIELLRREERESLVVTRARFARGGIRRHGWRWVQLRIIQLRHLGHGLNKGCDAWTCCL